MKIYTKQGDTGETQVPRIGRVSKANPMLEAVGSLDEVNSAVGLAMAVSEDTPAVCRRGLEIQHTLFDAGAHLSTQDQPDGLKRMAQLTLAMEEDMDRWTDQLPALRNFILPGGSHSAAAWHGVRTATRRAERSLAALNEEFPVAIELLAFINRLSDWAFVAARWENHHQEKSDVIWQKATEKEEVKGC